MKQLMLIESDPAIADAVRRVFQPVGVSVTTVPVGEQAVDRCKAARPDLVLLAAELPDMSGFSVCNRLKRALTDLAVIVYTGEATPAAIEAHKASRTRADDYLRKPFQMDELLGLAGKMMKLEVEAGAAAVPSGESLPDGDEPGTESGDEPMEIGDEELVALDEIQTGDGAPENGGTGAEEALPSVVGTPDEGPIATAVGVPLSPPGTAPAPSPPAGRTGTLTPPPVRPRSSPAIAVRPRRERREMPDPFVDAPRDPAPPKGGPDEKLEFFRERLRVRDTFIGKLREAVDAIRTEGLAAVGESEALARDLEAAHAGRLELERSIRDMGDAAQALRARLADTERRLREAESARKSMSEVLNDQIQAKEESDQAWSLKVAAADEARAKVEAQRREDLLQFEQHLEGKKLEWTGEKADLEKRFQLVQEELDQLASDNGQLQAQLKREQEKAEQSHAIAEGELGTLRAAYDEAQTRAQDLAVQLSEERSRGEQAQGRAAEVEQQLLALGEQLRDSQESLSSFTEKALNAEQAYAAKEQELYTLQAQTAELAAALEQGTSAQGEVSRLQAELSGASQREAALTAERDAIAARWQEQAAALDQAQAEIARLQGEAGAQREAASQGSGDAARLKRALARAEEIVNQQQADLERAMLDTATAQAERERVQDDLAGQISDLAGQLSQKDSEIAGLKRRIAAAEAEKQKGGGADAAKATAELETQRKNHIQEMVEMERRHVAEVGRLKSALVEMEKHLEARARTEMQLKKRINELQAATPDVTEVHSIPAGIQAELDKLKGEIEDLTSENDFLNSEVARFHQKNKDLAVEIEKLVKKGR